MPKTAFNVNMDEQHYDICVIGGGVNGCGIARDLSGRDYKVLLLEKGDLAEGTSSASTKLIHGGLRYLEMYEFGLVKKALRERDVLMHLAPHIIWPMRFILPYVPSLRPFWMIRLGVGLYDFLSGKTRLKKSCKTMIKNKKLNKKFKKGIEYSDCWVEDSRLVILNAMDAMARGATIKTRTQCVDIRADNGQWAIETDQGHVYKAQAVINAAGQWAGKITQQVEGVAPRSLRLVKGSHIVVPQLFSEPESYILQTGDKRIVFAIPYEGGYTLVGTTDVDVGHDPNAKIEADENEINYLKGIVKTYFDKTLTDADIVYRYSGVRPLIDEESGSASKASRDYKFDLQMIKGLPFLSVLGGKLTTYRVLAQEACDMMDKEFHKTPHHWTANEKLPGGDIQNDDLDAFVNEQVTNYPFLSKLLIRRYAIAYGTCMHIILRNAESLDDMGRDIGGGIYGRELDYLIAYEFAKTGEDVLWRRSKLGLHVDKQTQKAVDTYMKEHV